MKEIWVMKTFIVYNLDTRLPVAVGEAIKAEWARFETADKTKNFCGKLNRRGN